jgi:hypothetical protein
MGWKIRRIMKYIMSQPKMMEVRDLLKLMIDMSKEAKGKNDTFYEHIKRQATSKLSEFWETYTRVMESDDGCCIQKRNTKLEEENKKKKKRAEAMKQLYKRG